MEQYLIDTNVISDYFSASFSDKGFLFMDIVIDTIPKLSIISQIELLSWKADIVTEKSVRNFIEDSIIFNISTEIIEYSVALRRSVRIKIPDAIIAATAIANGYILITNNERDFKNIKDLKIINPKKL